ncbi:hypothetical protein [Phenylobacterium sp.]|uniref:hypothetical protein n=1 Tax=Phenylobacterium sp. TaxID=1871053 RepID=UPI002B7198A7|nr:hypothetical protein [Phenylobacterium sp.]HVI33580.1 hypothetical protein [Phenylobacterium sp.]
MFQDLTLLALASIAILGGAAATDRRAVEALSARLLASHSATAVLQEICDRRAPGERVRAEQLPPDAAAPDWVRQALDAPADAIRHRRVRLMCGPEVLSVADNWFLPGRLTAEMNATLEGTQTPFGVAVRSLDYRRRTLSVRYLDGGSGVLEHKAVLVADDRPFSLVLETYAAAAVR